MAEPVQPGHPGSALNANNFEARITRLPRAFAPDLGRGALERLPNLSPSLAQLISGTAGSSPYLAGLIETQADWLEEALDDPDAAAAAVLDDVTRLATYDLAAGLRRALA